MNSDAFARLVVVPRDGLGSMCPVKAGATIAAEQGATEHELMAIFGWETSKQAGVYTRKASKRRLAGAGMGKMISKSEAG